MNSASSVAFSALSPLLMTVHWSSSSPARISEVSMTARVAFRTVEFASSSSSARASAAKNASRCSSAIVDSAARCASREPGFFSTGASTTGSGSGSSATTVAFLGSSRTTVSSTPTSSMRLFGSSCTGSSSSSGSSSATASSTGAGSFSGAFLGLAGVLTPSSKKPRAVRRFSSMSISTSSALKPRPLKTAPPNGSESSFESLCMVGTTAWTFGNLASRRRCCASAARARMGNRAFFRFRATTAAVHALASAMAATTSRASPAMYESRTSASVASPWNTGLPAERACSAFCASFSRTTYLVNLASSISQTTLPIAPYPNTTTTSFIFTRLARSWANSSSAEVGTFKTASRNRSRSAVELSATGEACDLAIVSPSWATKGVAAMDMATVVNRTRFWPALIRLSFFARPKATNANSPLWAHRAPVLKAVGVDSFRSLPRAVSVTAFKATSPPASPNILRGCAANNETSMLNPTVTKNNPSNSPRNGATDAST
mmetsp:Transcript_20092/g.57016  ORF Transcript_20092/g.57016 Transcript_20092/m.57016 type:complete len:490 (+) Transcript_20092:59-1528(+)